MTDYTKPTSSPPPQSLPTQVSTSPQPMAQSTEAIAVSESNSFGDLVSEEPQPAIASSPIPPPVNLSIRPSQSPPSENAPVDPRVAALRSMFPDYDDLILQSVLESAGGNQDAAIEILLGMSDPNYKSEAPPQEPIVLSQTDLDEQLARRLMIEEQEQQQQEWLQQHPQSSGPRRRSSRPYQTHPSQTSPQMSGNATGEKDTMTEFQEQFNKVAEVGKKTFGSIFTKVKAKIQELEQGRPAQSSAEGAQQTYGGNYESNYSQQAGYPQYQQAHSVSQPQASYYDPNPSTPSPPTSHSSPPAQASAPVIQGYDVSSPSVMHPALSSVPAAASDSTSSSGVPPPPSTGIGSGVPIDGGKLGLLPKRPVSLVRDPATGQQQTVRKSLDSEDGLEYAENPFEDNRK